MVPTIILAACVAGLIAVATVAGSVSLVTAGAWLSDLPDVSSASDFNNELFESSAVYASNGELLGELVGEGRRTLLKPEEIPQLIKDATIASEDASFYDNPGVDLWAFLRAVWLNVQGKGIVSGFSTITQQVVKNNLLSPEQSVERKLREVILAYRLSQKLTKDEILALYLNQNNYGNLAYGISAAAQTYFDKTPEALNLAEVAMLVGIPRAPSAENPFVNDVAARRNQHNVLDLMAKNRFVTPAAVTLAKRERLAFRPQSTALGPAPHFFNYVADYLAARYGPDISRRGWRIITTLDPLLQEQTESLAREHVQSLTGRNAGNSAVIVLNPNNGQILSMVGSIDFSDESIDGQVNMSVSPRQPGSSFKPITYLTALKKGLTAASVLLDTPLSVPVENQEDYEPKNYDLKFRGPVTMRNALGSSLNIPAVRAQLLAGVPDTLATATDLGVSLQGGAERFGPALALGSGEVSLLEMAVAYGAFSNGGLLVESTPILKIEDSQGNLVSNPVVDSTRAISPELAYIITDILSDSKARIAGFGVNPHMEFDDKRVAIKTGTTNDFRDALTIGYTPQRVVAVWAGNADNTAMDDVSGARGALPLWRQVLDVSVAGLPYTDFKQPASLVTTEVDSVSGLLPSEYSPEVYKELFISGTQPVKRDTVHQPIRIHLPSGKRAGPDIPDNEVEVKVFPFLSSEGRAWQLLQKEDSPFYLPPEQLASSLDSLAPLPNASIALPRPLQQVRSILEVFGSAKGQQFQSHTLEVGAGSNPSEWGTVTGPSADQHDRGQLGAIDTAQLADGLYTLRLTVNYADGVRNIVLRQFISDNTSPAVTFANLSPGQQMPRGLIAFDVSATDNSLIEEISFFVDGAFVGTTVAKPYRLAWAAVPGSHTVRAIALDAAGNFAETPEIPFLVP